jgi:hypothetical protein
MKKFKKITFFKQLLIVLVIIAVIIGISAVFPDFALRRYGYESINFNAVLRSLITFIINLLKDALDKIL